MQHIPYESARAQYLRLKDVSTTDCDLPEMVFTPGELLLRFKDWHGSARQFTFRDVIAFRWQDALPLPPGVNGDYESAYEVTASPWLAELAGTEGPTRGVAYRHWLFCFHGFDCALEVVAADMTAA